MQGLVYDRTENDVINRTSKGFYRYTDLNRVSTAVTYLRGLVRSAGYDCVTSTAMKVWAQNDIPRYNQIDAYLRAVREFAALFPIPGKPELPLSPDRLNYAGANALEKFLDMVDDTITRIYQAWFYCDEVFAGEVDV